MGLFKNLRDGAKAVATMVSEVNAANEAATQNMPVTILNPSAQAEVDRLLVAGGIARGVVVHASHPPQHGEQSNSMGVDVRVRSRLADGALGDEVKLKIRTSSQVAALLDPGLEIPVILDRTTGLVTEIPTDELRSELEPRFGEVRSGWVADADYEGIHKVPGEIRDALRRLGKKDPGDDRR